MEPITLKPVSGGTPIAGPATVDRGQRVAKSDPTGFGEIFNQSINAVNASMQEAAALSTGLVAGQHSNIHETMIAMEKSSLSFRMLTTVQNKVIDAYKEIMRLQL